MLDNDNEPIAGVTEDTPDTQAKTQGRRRAARPAGPPPEPEDTPTVPAPLTDPESTPAPTSAAPTAPPPAEAEESKAEESAADQPPAAAEAAQDQSPAAAEDVPEAIAPSPPAAVEEAAEPEDAPPAITIPASAAPETSSTAQAEAAEAPTTRERGAARPAGPPPEVEDVPAVITVPASAVPVVEAEAVPEVIEISGSVEEAAEEGEGAQDQSLAAARERRAARPAGPPPEVEDVPAVITVSAGSGDGSGEVVPDEASAPAVVTVKNERRAARPAGPPPEDVEGVQEGEEIEAEEAAELGPDTELAEPVEDLAEVTGEAEAVLEAAAAFEPEPESEPKAPVKRTRARTRKTAEKPADEKPKAEETAGEEAAVPEEEPKKTRTRRRAVRKVEEPVEERAGETAPAAEQPAPLVADPFATAFAQPFATPFAAPVEPAPARAEESEPAGALDVVFQPPMVVFQPPSVIEPKPAQPPVEPQPSDEGATDVEGAEEAEGREEDETEDLERPARRRRRRGGRGRGKARDEAAEEEGAEESEPAEGAETAEPSEEQTAETETEESEEGEEDEGEESATSTSRRRRRRRRRSGGGDDEPHPDDPPNTVVRVRPPRVTRIEDEVQAVRGSTRLEAKKQRRREGREHGRRRPPIITEAEFLARRESVERVMVVRQEGERTQIGVLEDGVLVEHYVDRASHQSYVGNVYLGKVQNVLPSMEAAFVDIGKGRNAVLYAGEVNWDVAGLMGQPRRIESALKSGQSVLVQVTKDPLGHKGARLTSQISLPGRYLVYVPDGSMTGISRKLPDAERTRLKSILRKIMPENAGVIVRTAAEGASEEELAGDVSRLAAQWEHIQKQMKTATAPALLHGEPDMTIRVIRDIFNEDFVRLVVAGDGIWDQVQDYVSHVAPHLADRAEKWESAGDAFAHYRIDEQLAKALERKVWLPSGGSLVIDRTEAMTVVDVNTGKFTGQGGNLEETVTRNNLEAAEEIVRQLRLRDLGGIIVIDFIDMVLESNRDLVLRRLLECLARDRTKHQVAEVTSLGLVQMTRKRVGSGLLEVFSQVCECCNGRGIHVQLTPVDEGKPDGSAQNGGRKRKRKGEIERVVEAKLAKQESGRARSEEEAPVVVSVGEIPAVESQPAAKPRRARRTRPAGPPPEEFEDIGTVSLTLDSGETVQVEAVVGNPAASEPAPEPAGELAAGEEPAPKRRRARRLTRAEKIEAAKAEAE